MPVHQMNLTTQSKWIKKGTEVAICSTVESVLVQNDSGNVLVKRNPLNLSVLVEEKILKMDEVSVPLVGGDIVNTESGIWQLV